MTTKTTRYISLSRSALLVAHVRAWLLSRDPLLLIATVVVGALVSIALGHGLGVAVAPVAPPALAATPPLPIIMIATAPAGAPATPPPPDRVAAVLPHTLARAVVAYDAPDGRVIGAIDQGHAYRVVARYGADWLQADVAGSGVVWLRAADLFDLPSDLADMQPPPAPTVVYVPGAPQQLAPPAPAPSYQVDSAPPSAPPATLTTDERAAALDREFGLTAEQRDAALKEHNAQQAAWCADQHTSYCDMVRGVTR